MSLTSLPEGWMRFGAGRRWRCAAPDYLCEIDSDGNAPDYSRMSKIVSSIRRIKSYYDGRLRLGQLDEYGYGLDVMVANSFTESYGTVPSPLTTEELQQVYAGATGSDTGVKLDAVIRHVATRQKYLERREPGYSNPVDTPGRVSVGAHHVLISTALSLIGANSGGDAAKTAAIVELVCRVPADSLYAADLAVRYFNRSYGKHRNQPPLLAATYNAGAPRLTSRNIWNLVQYGEHLDRWITYYNTSRAVR